MLKLLAIPALVCMADTALAGVTPAQVTYESCRVCHDTAEGARIPPLAGRSADDLSAAFEAMAAAPEGQTIMHRFTAGLSADELAALSAYISALSGAGQ